MDASLSSSCDSSMVMSKRDDCECRVTGAARDREDFEFMFMFIGMVEFVVIIFGDED